MQYYKYEYITPFPLDNMIITSDGNNIIKIEFIKENITTFINDDLLIFEKVRCYLDAYFKGLNPSINFSYSLDTLTPFQKDVLEIVKDIPYGKTITYKEIGAILKDKKKTSSVSLQAIGHAIGKNPLAIIIPCHRVIGTHNIGGYHYGLTNKIELLKIENKDFNNTRCCFVNLKNKAYINYHDNAWGVLNLDEKYLYKMFILETFQAGLSWECILNKYDGFNVAFDNFDIDKIIKYDETKINELLNNPNIIRNKLKIKASIQNSIIYKQIANEYGSFKNYLLSFTNNKIYYERGKTTSLLSDMISKDLYKRKMSFVGSVTIYSYLQAIGIINSHDKCCFKYHQGVNKNNS